MSNIYGNALNSISNIIENTAGSTRKSNMELFSPILQNDHFAENREIINGLKSKFTSFDMENNSFQSDYNEMKARILKSF